MAENRADSAYRALWQHHYGPRHWAVLETESIDALGMVVPGVVAENIALAPGTVTSFPRPA